MEGMEKERTLQNDFIKLGNKVAQNLFKTTQKH